jgi:hypothetical protein
MGRTYTCSAACKLMSQNVPYEHKRSITHAPLLPKPTLERGKRSHAGDALGAIRAASVPKVPTILKAPIFLKGPYGSQGPP